MSVGTLPRFYLDQQAGAIILSGTIGDPFSTRQSDQPCRGWKPWTLVPSAAWANDPGAKTSYRGLTLNPSRLRDTPAFPGLGWYLCGNSGEVGIAHRPVRPPFSNFCNLLGCCGPQRAADFDLRLSDDVTCESSAMTRASFGGSDRSAQELVAARPTVGGSFGDHGDGCRGARNLCGWAEKSLCTGEQSRSPAGIPPSELHPTYSRVLIATQSIP